MAMDGTLERDPHLAMNSGISFPIKDKDKDKDKDESRNDLRAKTSIRMNYEAQVTVIKGQIGNLDSIRMNLGLSQRKMAQLLLIDPSTWSRWTQRGDSVPPHVYRALQWYMVIQDKIPGLNASYFLQKDVGNLKKEIEKNLSHRMDQLVFNSASEIERFEGEIIDLKQKLKDSEDAQATLSKKFKRLGLILSGIVFSVCFALVLVFLL